MGKIKKKKVKKQKAKKLVKSTVRKISHELVVRVQPQPILPVPTSDEIAQPISEGKALAIPKTWISEKQILRIVQRTPEQYVYTRPAKGGGLQRTRWKYVTGNYIEKVLNFTFGWMWDFEVLSHGVEGGVIWVQGKLTVKDDKSHTITKTQFGRAEVKMRRDGKGMLDFGNDLKAATTDALKKCASMLGIASDIYGSAEYKQETGNEVRDTQQTPPPAPKTTVAPVQAEATLLPGQVTGPDGKPTWLCSKDDEEISDQEAKFSKRVFGKYLCIPHQKEAKAKK